MSTDPHTPSKSAQGDNGGKAIPYGDDSDFLLWKEYEAVAMHFNELIIKLRTQALGGLAGVVTIAGVAANFGTTPATQTGWTILFGTVLFLTLAWVALAFLDMNYYHPLLKGAVKAILDHERTTHSASQPGQPLRGSIWLSTEIANKVSDCRANIVALLFYSLVGFGLLLTVFYTGYKAGFVCSETTQALERTLDQPRDNKSNQAAAKLPDSEFSSSISISQSDDDTSDSITKNKRVYLAGPLFTQGEWQWNKHLATELRKRSLDVILPQDRAEPMLSGARPFNPPVLFQENIDGINSAEVIVAILDGADVDSGTAWECGFAFSSGKPVIGVRTDIRAGGDDPKRATNLMLSASCQSFVAVPLATRNDVEWVASQIAEKVQAATAPAK